MSDQEIRSTQASLANPMQPVIEVIQGADRDAVSAKYGLSRPELDSRIQQYLSSMKSRALAEGFIAKRVGRNEPCPCGSGKKYKKCCMAKHDEVRKSLPPEQLQQMEEKSRERERLEKEAAKGFGFLVDRDFHKARRLAEKSLESYPDDDRFHDILVSTYFATGDYDKAFIRARQRWQVALEEREHYQENGFHKREGVDRKQLVCFYSPSTWLEKFWIAQRAKAYREEFPLTSDERIESLVKKLLLANDTKRFPQREEQGLTARREALGPVLDELVQIGSEAIPHLLPLTYHFSWASLFVPELLEGYGGEECTRLLAELSMFRFPYFAQMCLKALEEMGENAFPQIKSVVNANPAFDELKVGLLMVLGAIQTEQSFQVLIKYTEHTNPYLVNWAAQALGRQKNPEAIVYLEKAKKRVGELSKIQGALKDLAQLKKESPMSLRSKP